MSFFNRRVQLSGGNKCFVRCPGCYNFFSNKDYKTTDLLNFLSELKEKSNVSKLTMAGGEPLAREDMPYILEALKEMGFSINLDTVGLSIIRDVEIGKHFLVKKIAAKEIVKSVNVIGIPFDGSTDSLQHLFRRNLKISEIVNILDELTLNGARIGINTVVHKQNYEDILNIFKYLRRYKSIIKWQLFQFMPIGPGGFKNKLKYELSDEKFDQLGEILKDINDTHIDIQLKSRLNRKNKYLLIDGEGVIWIPRQNDNPVWAEEDVNNERILLGNINDLNAVDNIMGLLPQYETSNESNLIQI